MSGLPLDLVEQPWALEPSRLSRILAQLQRPDERAAAGPTGRPAQVTRVGPVSVVPIIGVISHRPGLESLFGMGTSVEEIRANLRAEVSDPSVKAVVLDIDSPGGTVAGVPELATEIRALRDRKPIVAVANTTAGSAAYWLMAQASEAIVTPSGQVGSVGIYAIHQEASKHLEQEGVTTTVIGIPDAKIDANEFSPLSEEAKTHIAERAATFYGQFVGDVAAGRKLPSDHVEARFGGGRMLLSGPAQRAGMVDRVATLDSTIARLYREHGGGTTTRRQIRAEAPELFMVATDEMSDEVARADEQAKAIGSHKTETATGSWDGPANEARLPSGEGAAGALRAAHAWVDPDGDPNAKSSYKFIHHEVSAEGSVGAANLTGCSAGIAVLNGGRGGTTIPDGDVAGVHAHLAAHMMAGDMEPPELKSEEPGSLYPFGTRLDRIAAEALDLTEHAQERARLRAKEGRPPLSASQAQALRSIRDATSTLLALADPEPVVMPPTPAAPVNPPPTPVTDRPRRFANDAAWVAYLKKEYEEDVRG